MGKTERRPRWRVDAPGSRRPVLFRVWVLTHFPRSRFIKPHGHYYLEDESLNLRFRHTRQAVFPPPRKDNSTVNLGA